jgi:hypothetical protein
MVAAGHKRANTTGTANEVPSTKPLGWFEKR